MGRIMAIDFGRKRTGLAVTDSLQIAANPLSTVATHTAIDYIRTYCSHEQVDMIVLGNPKRLDNTLSDSQQQLRPFLRQLQKALPQMKIILYDERFTSTLAHRAMIDGGMKRSDRRDKANVDTIAATIILTDYLQSLSAQRTTLAKT